MKICNVFNIFISYSILPAPVLANYQICDSFGPFPLKKTFKYIKFISFESISILKGENNLMSGNNLKLLEAMGDKMGELQDTILKTKQKTILLSYSHFVMKYFLTKNTIILISMCNFEYVLFKLSLLPQFSDWIWLFLLFVVSSFCDTRQLCFLYLNKITQAF